MPGVEWETLVFFAGLFVMFVMVGALVKTGVIGRVAEAAATATGGDALERRGWRSPDPYTAAMSPVVLELAQGVADPNRALGFWPGVLCSRSGYR